MPTRDQIEDATEKCVLAELASGHGATNVDQSRKLVGSLPQAYVTEKGYPQFCDGVGQRVSSTLKLNPHVVLTPDWCADHKDKTVSDFIADASGYFDSKIHPFGGGDV